MRSDGKNYNNYMSIQFWKLMKIEKCILAKRLRAKRRILNAGIFGMAPTFRVKQGFAGISPLRLEMRKRNAGVLKILYVSQIPPFLNWCIEATKLKFLMPCRTTFDLRISIFKEKFF